MLATKLFIKSQGLSVINSKLPMKELAMKYVVMAETVVCVTHKAMQLGLRDWFSVTARRQWIR